MKIFATVFLLILSTVSLLSAQEFNFEVDTLLFNGNSQNRINLAILGDGYQEHELDKFIQDAQTFLGKFYRTTPIKEYKGYFNVVAIKVISEESGASHPGTASDEFALGNHPVISVNNFFGSTFDYAGIHRLLVATNDFRISSVLATNFPEYDQAIILVNSPFYGGAGGRFPTASTERSSADVAIHELGHSFARLSDEYWAGNQYAGESPNMTRITDPELVKWNSWMNTSGVGIYQHCCGGNSGSWYKPHQQCKMQFVAAEFCPVCIETFVEKFHSLVSPLDGYRPVEELVTENIFPRTFALDLIHSNPRSLSIEWNLNGKVVGTNVDSVSLTDRDLEEGNNRLVATVVDDTPLSRSEVHNDLHHYSVVWTVKYSSVSTVIESVHRSLHLSTFPNPSSGRYQVRYELEEESDVGINVVDMQGKLLKEGIVQKQEAGDYAVDVNLTEYPDGVYFVQCVVDGIVFQQKIVKTN